MKPWKARLAFVVDEQTDIVWVSKQKPIKLLARFQYKKITMSFFPPFHKNYDPFKNILRISDELSKPKAVMSENTCIDLLHQEKQHPKIYQLWLSLLFAACFLQTNKDVMKSPDILKDQAKVAKSSWSITPREENCMRQSQILTT